MLKNNCLLELLYSNRLADTHVHLHSHEYERKERLILERAQSKGVREIWLVGIDFHSSMRNIDFVAEWQPKFPGLKLRLGVGFDMELVIPGSDMFDSNWYRLSPQQASDKVNQAFNELFGHAKKKLVEIDLIGETGMDFYWLERNYQLSINNEEHAIETGVFLRKDDFDHSVKLQEEIFRAQLVRAAQSKLPVSIHSRGAESEVFELVNKIQKDYTSLTGVFHSFTGNPLVLRQILTELDNFAVGLNGIITYKSAESLRRGVFNQLRRSQMNSQQNDEAKKDSQPAFERQSHSSQESMLQNLYSAKFVLETDAPYLLPGNSNQSELQHLIKSEKPINEPANVSDILTSVMQRYSGR